MPRTYKPVPPREKFTARIDVPLAPSVLDKLKAKAGERGVGMTELARRLISEGVGA